MSHYSRIWGDDKAPDISELPITIYKRSLFQLIRKIEIAKGSIRVFRRFLSDWSEPLSSFLYIDCVMHGSDDPILPNLWYTVKLVHPKRGKTLLLYEIIYPKFDVDEFVNDLSDILNVPGHGFGKFHRAHW